MPAISIIIPAYNAEKTILSTIKSVQQQTFSDLEIIVINDGSTDRTLEILHTIDDERLKVFSYQNSKAANARNHGISHATGDFVSFLDADDLWTSDKLELQLAALQAHPEAGVAYSWTYTINPDGEILYAIEPQNTGNIYQDLLLSNFLASGSNPLIRRAAIDSVGKFDTTLLSGEDWDYWLRLAHQWPFVVVPKHHIFYLRSATSKSYKLQIIRDAGLKIIDKAYKTTEPELQYLKHQSLANVYQYNVQLYLENLQNNHTIDIKYVWQNLGQALSLYPQKIFHRQTQNVIFKLLLSLMISPQLMSRLLQLHRRKLQVNQPQSELLSSPD